MRKYSEEWTGRLMQIRCNKCGREIRMHDGFPEEGVFRGECAWGYFSRKDGESHSFDLCEDCYDEWIRSFALPVQAEENHELL